MNKLDLVLAIAHLRDLACSVDVREIAYSNDLRDLQKVCESLKGHAPGEHFRRSLHTIPPSRVIWISATSYSGNIVGLVAARLDEISGWTLQEYIHEHFARCFRSEGGGPISLVPESSGFASKYTGPCAYLGEGYVHDNWRNRGLITHLVRLLMLLAYDEWKPTVLYGWMRKRHAITGMATKWGFTEIVPMALEFDGCPDDLELTTAYFVGCDGNGIHQMIRGLSLD